MQYLKVVGAVRIQIRDLPANEQAVIRVDGEITDVIAGNGGRNVVLTKFNFHDISIQSLGFPVPRPGPVPSPSFRVLYYLPR